MRQCPAPQVNQHKLGNHESDNRQGHNGAEHELASKLSGTVGQACKRNDQEFGAETGDSYGGRCEVPVLQQGYEGGYRVAMSVE